MTDREDRALAALDVHFRTQLAAAADAHALHVDLKALLKTVLAAGNGHDHNGAAVDSSR
jgi:hypothetical protein